MAMIDFFWPGLSATNASIETPGLARPGHDPDAVDRLVAIEGRLDLAQLDPVAAALDHPVAAAVELEAAGAVVAHQVAGAIPARAVGVDEERRLGQVGPAEVAAHHARPGDHQLAERARRARRGRRGRRPARGAAGRPGRSGNGSSRSAGISSGIGYAVQTLVSVGP